MISRAKEENELPDAARMLAACLEELPLMFAVIDREFRFVAVSEKWRRKFPDAGVARGMPVEEYFPGMDPVYRESFARVLDGEERHGDGIPIVRQDGRTELIDWSMRAWTRGDGAVGGVIFIVEAVTERRALDAELRYLRSLERAISRIATSFINVRYDDIGQSITEALGDIGRLSDVDRSMLVEMDDAGRQLAGGYEWSADGTQAPALVVPAAMLSWLMGELRRDRDVCIPDVAALPDEAAAEREFLLARNGRSFLAIPLVARDRLVAVFGFTAARPVEFSERHRALLRTAGQILLNVLLRRNAENALTVSENRARLLLENAADALFLVGADGIIVDVNTNACEQTGYEAGELRGSPIIAVDKKFSLPELRDRLMAGGGGVITVESEITRKDGRRIPVETRICPFPGDGRPMAVAVARDISVRREMEAKQQQLIDELREALANVKMLSGLLPICASCKKIRDDQGYWHKVEKYIAGHSGASFTHGLCPDCLKEEFGPAAVMSGEHTARDGEGESGDV